MIDDLTPLRLTQQVAPFSEESLNSDHLVKFYTGLPNILVLKSVFSLVEKAVQGGENYKLSLFQEFMATVIKLRLNCQVQDLFYRFKCTVLPSHMYFSSG